MSLKCSMLIPRAVGRVAYGSEMEPDLCSIQPLLILLPIFLLPKTACHEERRHPQAQPDAVGQLLPHQAPDRVMSQALHSF